MYIRSVGSAIERLQRREGELTARRCEKREVCGRGRSRRRGGRRRSGLSQRVEKPRESEVGDFAVEGGSDQTVPRSEIAVNEKSLFAQKPHSRSDAQQHAHELDGHEAAHIRSAHSFYLFRFCLKSFTNATIMKIYFSNNTQA